MKKKILIILTIVVISLIAILAFFLLLIPLWLPETINDSKFKTDYAGIIKNETHFKMSVDKLYKLKGKPEEYIADDGNYIHKLKYKEKIYNIETQVQYEFHMITHSELFLITYIIPIATKNDKEIFNTIYKDILDIYKDNYDIINYTDELEASEIGIAKIIAKSKIDKSEIIIDIKLNSESLTIVAQNNYKWKR